MTQDLEAVYPSFAAEKCMKLCGHRTRTTQIADIKKKELHYPFKVALIAGHNVNIKIKIKSTSIKN